jgi:pimeloyl-ACP methyl ester carboxylesterase
MLKKTTAAIAASLVVLGGASGVFAQIFEPPCDICLPEDDPIPFIDGLDVAPLPLAAGGGPSYPLTYSQRLYVHGYSTDGTDYSSSNGKNAVEMNNISPNYWYKQSGEPVRNDAGYSKTYKGYRWSNNIGPSFNNQGPGPHLHVHVGGKISYSNAYYTEAARLAAQITKYCSQTTSNSTYRGHCNLVGHSTGGAVIGYTLANLWQTSWRVRSAYVMASAHLGAAVMDGLAESDNFLTYSTIIDKYDHNLTRGVMMVAHAGKKFYGGWGAHDGVINLYSACGVFSERHYINNCSENHARLAGSWWWYQWGGKKHNDHMRKWSKQFHWKPSCDPVGIEAGVSNNCRFD